MLCQGYTQTTSNGYGLEQSRILYTNMKTKVIFTCVLIIALHLSVFLPSCDLFMRCGDTLIIEAPVDHVVLFAYSWTQIENTGIQRSFPLDRKNLRLSIGLSANDTIDLYAQMHGTFFINSAFADDCASPVLRLTEHIENIEIWQLSDSLVEISELFLVESFDSDLYQEIDSYLKQADSYQLNLAYKDSLLMGDVTFLVKTHLSDQRILSDTANFDLE
ncbi:MAG: hypothetical protein ACJA08_000977 [Cyclobacteriaceae bacterium]|jgi:hypothetical protein